MAIPATTGGPPLKLVSRRVLLNNYDSSRKVSQNALEKEIRKAVRSVVWPESSDKFTIYAESGKKRGQGSGVKPIKDCFVRSLLNGKWLGERILGLPDKTEIGVFDAVRPFPSTRFQSLGKERLLVESGQFAVVEWETGNISSSHRSLNRMALGMIKGVVAAGFLIVPTRNLAQYLTDRVGNLEELEPYFPVWEKWGIAKGLLEIISVEHDEESTDLKRTRRIPKGTDGRARQ